MVAAQSLWWLVAGVAAAVCGGGLAAAPGAAAGADPEAAAAFDPATPQVATANGVVQGVATALGRYFRGIPYAAPPVGNLRLAETQPPLNWTGVLDASQFGANCVQITEVVNNQTICPAWHTISGCSKMSEDCLFLNVYTPNVTAATPAAQKWPVMVYVHAGEFYVGAGNDLESNWPYALHDVVVITFNYRLGTLGFMGDEVLRSRSRGGSTGNYGLQDQRAVLQWVQKNVAAFGGDPNNVALWGESSGGTSVAAHLVLKKSWGLFHKVIMQSPGVTQFKPMADTQADARFRLATLALRKVPGCALLPFGGGYDTPGAWLELANCPIAGKALWTAAYPTVRDAVNACNANASCVALTYHNTTSPKTNATVVTASFTATYRAVLPRTTTPTTTFLRAPNVSTMQACFDGMTATALGAVYEAPHEDTAFQDLFAPTVDGVELTTPLTAGLLSGPLPPGVQYLIGSNLDEGTEFIPLTAAAPCAMTAAALPTWALTTFTLDRPDFTAEAAAKIAAGIVATYLGNASNASDTRLEMPVPSCSGAVYPANSAFLAATRATGDACFFCWVRALAERITTASPLGMNGSAVYNYYFTHTPTVSLNMPALPTYGAFHGSEVPFVFGFPSELGTDAERRLSSSMGCYWSNFAHTGNPNKGPCNNSAVAPVAWPLYKPTGSAPGTPSSTLVLNTGNATSTPPTAPVHAVQNLRVDKCALFEPVIAGAAAAAGHPRPADRRRQQQQHR